MSEKMSADELAEIQDVVSADVYGPAYVQQMLSHIATLQSEVDETREALALAITYLEAIEDRLVSLGDFQAVIGLLRAPRAVARQLRQALPPQATAAEGSK